MKSALMLMLVAFAGCLFAAGATAPDKLRQQVLEHAEQISAPIESGYRWVVGKWGGEHGSDSPTVVPYASLLVSSAGAVSGTFAIQAGLYADLQSAQRAMQRLNDVGSATVLPIGGQDVDGYVLAVGRYSTLSEANRQLELLRLQMFDAPSLMVIRLPQPADAPKADAAKVAAVEK